MGHLFEKRKICHGCQGNYHSERKRGGRLHEERKKRSPTAFMDRIRLWWNIIPARQPAAGPVLSFFSLSTSPPLFMSSSLSHSFHFPHLPLSACPSVFLALAHIFPSPLHISLTPLSLISLFFYPSCCSIIKYQCEICLQLEA